MNMVLVDTDILIDISRQDVVATSRIDQEKSVAELVISTITVMELSVGCRNKQELQFTNRFLSKFRILPLTPAISDQASELIQTYFLSHGLLIPDALIAATALENKIPLLSKNQRDYRFIYNLQLLPYP